MLSQIFVNTEVAHLLHIDGSLRQKSAQPRQRHRHAPRLRITKSPDGQKRSLSQITNDVRGNCPKSKSPDGQKRSLSSPRVATPGGGLIRRAALILGTTKLGATVSIPFTYAKSFNPAEARYQARKTEQNVTAIAHPS